MVRLATPHCSHAQEAPAFIFIWWCLLLEVKSEWANRCQHRSALQLNFSEYPREIYRERPQLHKQNKIRRGAWEKPGFCSSSFFSFLWRHGAAVLVDNNGFLRDELGLFFTFSLSPLLKSLKIPVERSQLRDLPPDSPRHLDCGPARGT